MMKYSKAVAGIVGAVVIYLVDTQFGFDAAAMGVADEIKLIIDAAIVGAVIYVSPANAE